MCATCRRWFHPGCIGLKDDQEPEIFVCEACTTEVMYLYFYFEYNKYHHDTVLGPYQMKAA